MKLKNHSTDKIGQKMGCKITIRKNQVIPTSMEPRLKRLLSIIIPTPYSGTLTTMSLQVFWNFNDNVFQLRLYECLQNWEQNPKIHS